MVNITSIDAFNDQVSGVAESGHNFHGLLIDAIRHEILSQCTVVRVSYFFFRICLRLFLRLPTTIVQVLNVHEIDVSILITIAFIASDETS